MVYCNGRKYFVDCSSLSVFIFVMVQTTCRGSLSSKPAVKQPPSRYDSASLSTVVIDRPMLFPTIFSALHLLNLCPTFVQVYLLNPLNLLDEVPNPLAMN